MIITNSVYTDIENIISQKCRFSIFSHEDEIIPEELAINDNLVSSFSGQPEATLMQFITLLKEVSTHRSTLWSVNDVQPTPGLSGV